MYRSFGTMLSSLKIEEDVTAIFCDDVMYLVGGQSDGRACGYGPNTPGDDDRECEVQRSTVVDRLVCWWLLQQVSHYLVLMQCQLQ